MTALLLIFAVISPADASTNDQVAEVQRLVRQLDAPELSTRDRAEEQLISLGAAVLDLLPKESEGSAELQQRLARVRQTLKNKSVIESVKSSTVTLSGSKSLSEALAAIEKQTGNKIVDFRQQLGQEVTDPNVETDFEKVQFWQAMDTLLDRAEMTVYNYSHEEGLAIISKSEQQSARSLRANYVGPLRLEVTRISAEKVPAIENSGSLRVTLEIAWEPRLQPITFQHSLASLEAIDDQGNEIEPAGREGALETATQKSTAVEMELPLIAPPRTAKSIASLKGSLTALVPGKIETFEFDDLAAATNPEAKPIEKKHAAATVTLDGVRKNNDVWEVRLRIRFDAAANALESHRTWIFDNEAYLVGADQKRIEHGGYETTLHNENEVGVAYLFDSPANLEGYTFVYKTPSSLQVIPVEYELKDLPLP